jgi:hypothetical protein
MTEDLRPDFGSDELQEQKDMMARQHGPGPPGGVQTTFAFCIVNPICMALLHGRAGRLTAHNGGFRPGQ